MADNLLGKIIRDPATGIQGTATAKCELLAGSIQYAIQPPAKDGKVEGSVCVDHFLLEVVEDGLSGRVPPPDATVTVKLGNRVVDPTAGIEGIAVEKVTHLNGCVYFAVQPKAKKGEVEAPKCHYIDHKRLKVLDRGLAPADGTTQAHKTGGPNRPGPSMRTTR